MLTFVRTIEQLVNNFHEYQKAAKGASVRVNSTLVRRWYYIPCLDMVAGSRFIGYKDMIAERYDQNYDVDGRDTEPHLRSLGWFYEIDASNSLYNHVMSLAQSLSAKGTVYPSAKFYVLKDVYDQQVCLMMEAVSSSTNDNS